MSVSISPARGKLIIIIADAACFRHHAARGAIVEMLRQAIREGVRVPLRKSGEDA